MKIVIAGNCQSVPIARAMKHCTQGVNVIPYTVHSANEKICRSFESDIEDADHVLAFKVAETFRLEPFRYTHLKERLGSKLKTITNLFFSGYHPDYTYVNKLEGGRLLSFLGDYHSKICLVGALKGESHQAIRHAMLDSEFGIKAGYQEIFNKSIHELIQRDKEIDIGYAKRLSEIAESDRLFLTFNHPKNYIIYDYVYQLLSFLGIEYRFVLPSETSEYLGGGPVLASHPSVQGVFKTSSVNSLNERAYVKPAGSSYFVNIDEFISLCLDGYSVVPDNLGAHILEREWAASVSNAYLEMSY